jgi:hypothetical protein
LTIDRINQQGEILSSKMIQRLQQVKDETCGPLVRRVQFNAFGPAPGSWTERWVPRVITNVRTAVQLHQMAPLAKQLVAWSEDNPQSYAALPVANPNCATDYRMLDPDPNEPVVAMNGKAVRMALNSRKSREAAARSSRAPSWAEQAGEIQAFAVVAEPVAASADAFASDGHQRTGNGRIAKAGGHTRSMAHRARKVKMARL